MQKLMPQVDTPDNAFHDGNPATGELGTPVYAVWLNAVQGAVRDIQAECHAILTANGFTPDPSRQNQLWAAIQKAIDSKVPAASTSQAGKVQLSSATNSSSEQTAATSKAVKAVKDYADTKAPLNSPALSGTPTAPTPPSSASGLEIATAAFVAAKVAKLVDSSPAALDTLKELADALGRDPNFATTMTNALAGKQPLNSTLTALSGKNVAQLLEYLGLRGTVDQAAGALQKAQNGGDIPNKDRFLQAIRGAKAIPILYIDGTNGDWTTAQFIQWLESQGAFNFPHWVCKGNWSYGRSKTISDTGCGRIHLAGAVIEVIGDRGSKTIRITTPTTTSYNGVPNAQFTYINHGDNYAPGWRRDYNTQNPQPAFALGRTGDTAATDKGIAWDAPSGVYQANVTGASCMILHFNMGVGSCPAVQFKVNYRNGGIAYRSARDRAGFESDWVELMPATKTVQDIRLSTREQVQVWSGPGYGDQPPYVITGVLNSNRDDFPDTVYRRALQKLINGTWYNVGGL
ncbi:TPA: tail fiber protein [Escherichia coli]|nr:tail fiber protein [Escherichia coli]